MKKILMILTSHAEMRQSDSTTGVWLGEFTDPYYLFLDEGYEITLATPEGGEPPVDPRSRLTENITASNRRFREDDAAREKFNNTIKLSEINPAGYDALFYPGGHGPMWDLAKDPLNAEILLSFVDAGKPVVAICHGPAALMLAAEKRNGLLKDRKITGFTNTEERLVGLFNNIPFSLQDELKNLGARFESSTIPFTSKVVEDGWLITGQNPASSGPAAKKLIEKFKSVPYRSEIT